jgi:hypothetical protein
MQRANETATPQLTEQQGQVERVSVVRAILSSFACARTGLTSNPRRSAAAQPVPTLKNSRLDRAMGHPHPEIQAIESGLSTRSTLL